MLKENHVTLIILALLIILAGCSNERSTFGNKLENTNEVLVKSEKFQQKITDKDRISDLVGVLNKSKPIDTPEKAKGINLEVAKETVLLHFPRADFAYIGDGYLYYGNNGQYYQVSVDIEKYTSQIGD